MLFSFAVRHDEMPQSTEPAPTRSCPVCNGRVRELRGLVQCQRCQFIYCQGCDGEVDPPVADTPENW